MSNSESFGVSALEAMACECPVVASDADGFTEVIEDGVSGIIVPRRNTEAAAAALQKFIDNPQMKEKMGKAARERVCKLYEWDTNVKQMVEIYRKFS
jgi:glycosyltransferase involved in cell wall biosynthesis